MKQVIDVTYPSHSEAREESERLREEFTEGIILAHEVKSRVPVLRLVVASRDHAN